jgi:hypothetical protein
MRDKQRKKKKINKKKKKIVLIEITRAALAGSSYCGTGLHLQEGKIEGLGFRFRFMVKIRVYIYVGSIKGSKSGSKSSQNLGSKSEKGGQSKGKIKS